MTSYTIQESPLGTYALLLGTQLIMQAIVQELRNEPQLTEKEKFDKVFAHFETEAKK